MELNADAVAIGAGMLAVGQSPNVVNPQNGEDVVDADAGFHVRLLAHGLAQGIGGEKENGVGSEM